MTNLVNQAANPIAKLILAHGAGAGQNSEFMQQMAHLLSVRGITVIRFDFPYMQTIAQTGKKRPPDKASVLLEAFTRQIQQAEDGLPLFIGGKSMGGRIASMLLQQQPVTGGVCLGYPFHPPGKPEKLRTGHLADLTKPLLILQGERDTFGNQQEVAAYTLSKSIRVQFLADGDHSFKPRKASGMTQEQHYVSAADSIATFIQETV